MCLLKQVRHTIASPRVMFKEVVVSASLKENTINIWDLNSCSNIFEFKDNYGIRNGTGLCGA